MIKQLHHNSLYATLGAEQADCVSLRAQPSVSQLLTPSEQQLLGDYSTPVTEHAGEHARSLSLLHTQVVTYTGCRD